MPDHASQQDAFDAHVALKKVLELSEACAHHGLPCVILVGLPGHTNVDSEVVRASVGMSNGRNRVFMAHKFLEYMEDYAKGDVKPNRKIIGGGS